VNSNDRRIKDGLQPWPLPVKIVKGDTIKMLALKHGENSHRREQTAMGRARAAYELSQQMPEEKAAIIMGLGLAQFRNIMKLNNVAPAVAKAVTKGDLGETSAIELSTLSEAEQTAQLATIMATAAESGKKPTTRDVKAKVRETNGKAPLETPTTRINKVTGILDKIEDGATKDDLWSAIKKIRQALKLK